MNPERVLTALYNRLKTKATAWRADIEIADGLLNALQRLADAPGGRRIVIHWPGDQRDGNEPFVALSTSQIDLFVAEQRSMALDRSAEVRKTDGSSLVGFVHTVRKQVLGSVWTLIADGPATRPEYIGTEEVVLPDGMPLDAYKISFGLDLGVVESEAGYNITIPE